MDKGKICSFFGHSEIDLTSELYALTEKEIRKAIELNCHTFYFGGFGEFDKLCYDIITKIRSDYPLLPIKRVFCVPLEKYLYKTAPFFRSENYDEVIYLTPSFDGWYKSIYYRNCAMIDQSDVIIFYAEAREKSGAYKAYKYASRKKGKTVINIF